LSTGCCIKGYIDEYRKNSSGAAMKIMFVNNNLRGLLHFRMDVMRHLQAQGYEVVAVVPSSERDKQDVHGPRILYVPMERKSVNPFRDMMLFFSLVKVFRQEKPQYAFLYTIKPNIYGTLAAKLCGVRSSMMMAGLGFAFANNSLQSRIARSMYRIALKFSEHLFLLNEGDVKTVKDLGMCRSDKITLLKSGEGVNLQRFEFHDNRSERVRFLFVGRLLREKGVLDFVEAAKEVKRKYPEIMFQIAGLPDTDSYGNLTSEEMAMVTASDVVDYLGRVDMVEKLKESGQVMVIPSYYSEGLNRSLMEGCATGKPIITTNHPGCREMVIDGKNGFLVPVRQPHALAEAMLRYMSLSDDERQQMSQESRRLAESRFDVRSVFNAYDEIFRHVAD